MIIRKQTPQFGGLRIRLEVLDQTYEKNQNQRGNIQNLFNADVNIRNSHHYTKCSSNRNKSIYCQVHKIYHYRYIETHFIILNHPSSYRTHVIQSNHLSCLLVNSQESI